MWRQYPTMNRFSIAFAALTFSAFAFAQGVGPADGVQQGYMSNLPAGLSYLNITNTGVLGAALGFGTPTNLAAGDICANVYVFDPGQEMISCCTCHTTPDGLYSMSSKDLAGNPLTSVPPSAIVIKIVATAFPGAKIGCDATNTVLGGGALVPVTGLRAWATTLHANVGTGLSGFSMTENALAQGNGTALSGAVELTELPIECLFTSQLGSGTGVCAGCLARGLASAKQ